MARGIVKIKSYYFEWSSVCYAPASFGMTLSEASKNLSASQKRRLEEVGTTYLDLTKERVGRFVSFNRAGPKETSLTHAEIIKAYAMRLSIYKQCRGERGWWTLTEEMSWVKGRVTNL